MPTRGSPWHSLLLLPLVNAHACIFRIFLFLNLDTLGLHCGLRQSSTPRWGQRLRSWSLRILQHLLLHSLIFISKLLVGFLPLLLNRPISIYGFCLFYKWVSCYSISNCTFLGKSSFTREFASSCLNFFINLHNFSSSLRSFSCNLMSSGNEDKSILFLTQIICTVFLLSSG